MRVELTLSGKGEVIREGQLRREVSKSCGRRFDLPTMTESGGVIRAAMCELPMYDIEIGSDQHIAQGGKLCGDCIDYFNDGMGRTYALVCDGMGTGGRAAVTETWRCPQWAGCSARDCAPTARCRSSTQR